LASTSDSADHSVSTFANLVGCNLCQSCMASFFDVNPGCLLGILGAATLGRLRSRRQADKVNVRPDR